MTTPRLSSSLLSAIQTNDSLTANGCATNSTSGSYLVDLFFQISAMRNRDDQDIITVFSRAFSEDPLCAMKILFWSRDIRKGQGERRIFKTIIKNLSKSGQRVVRANVHNIPVFGRWDDLFCLFGTPLENDALDFISRTLSSPENSNAAKLCAKWMPREKSAKKVLAKKIRGHMKLSAKAYRKLLSGLTSVVETGMCNNDWDSIDYEAVPSVAMLRYKNAFNKHSPGAWAEFVSDLESGKAKINAGVLHPHQIAFEARRGDDCGVLDAQWNSLPNYLMNNPNRMLPVVDTSGSMYGVEGAGFAPIDVSVALGLYIAERNNGPFKDFFITFSETPSLVRVSGSSLEEKLKMIEKSDWGYSTNLEATFDLILNNALQHDIAEEDMPNVVLVISDMEFDHSCDNYSAIDLIRNKYDQAGYVLPKIVFWNVNARPNNVPVKFDDHGTAMISGFSPSIMKDVLSESEISPKRIMKNVIDSPRYSCVVLQ